MRLVPWRCLASLLLLATAAAGRAQRAQLPAALPPPPVVERPLPAASTGLQRCVPRYGASGCAARLYAELLCSLGDQGEAQAVQAGQRWLAQRYEQAGLGPSDLSPAQIEQLAVEEQVPQLCPDSSDALRRLFSGSGRSRP